MSQVHPTAVIGAGAEIGQGVEIGPYCVLGPNVKVLDGARLMSHVVVDGWTTIGSGCTIFPFASIGTQTQDLKFRGGKTFVDIGSGTTIREYVTVNSGTAEGEVTRVGERCHVMAYSHVAHACDVGNEVIMANCATLAGHVKVEQQAVIGGLAAVHQFVKIGRLCMIGGCTKVTQDCPPFMLVDGNPAGVHGINSIGLQRRNVSADAQHSLKEAYRWLYRKKLSVSQALEQIGQEVPPCPELTHLLSFVKASERGIIR